MAYSAEQLAKDRKRIRFANVYLSTFPLAAIMIFLVAGVFGLPTKAAAPALLARRVAADRQD